MGNPTALCLVSLIIITSVSAQGWQGLVMNILSRYQSQCVSDITTHTTFASTLHLLNNHADVQLI